MAIARESYSALVKQTLYELTVDEYQLGSIAPCAKLRKPSANSDVSMNGSPDSLRMRIIYVQKYDEETKTWKNLFYKKKVLRQCNCVPDENDENPADQICSTSTPAAMNVNKAKLTDIQKCFIEAMFNEGYVESDFALSDIGPGTAQRQSIEYAQTQPQGN